MIYLEPVKKLTKWQANKLSELFTEHDKSGNKTQIYVAYIDDPHIKTKQGRFVGAISITFENFMIHNGKPYFDIFINTFEVVKHWRGNKIGATMFYRLIHNDKFKVSKVGLIHMTSLKDKGASYRFWKHMGFHKPDSINLYMEKTIRKF